MRQGCRLSRPFPDDETPLNRGGIFTRNIHFEEQQIDALRGDVIFVRTPPLPLSCPDGIASAGRGVKSRAGPVRRGFWNNGRGNKEGALPWQAREKEAAREAVYAIPPADQGRVSLRRGHCGAAARIHQRRFR